MAKIDLHMHSNASDGKYSPKELIDFALEKKIFAIALTDHDTIKGIFEGINYAKDKEVEFIPGIEITVTPPKNCKELHMVGLFIDSENNEIKNIKKRHKKYAEKVIKKMIKKLNDLKYEITFEELLNETKEGHLERPWIANILMRKYPKEFNNRKEVFNELLGKNGKVFVRPKGTSMKKAIEIIHNAGGIAIIAHPWYLGEHMKCIIKRFIKLRGDGIERDHLPEGSIPEDAGKILDELIEKYNILISGGTDFHEFKNGRNEIGDRGISKAEFDKLKKYKMPII